MYNKLKYRQYILKKQLKGASGFNKYNSEYSQ